MNGSTHTPREAYNTLHTLANVALSLFEPKQTSDSPQPDRKKECKLQLTTREIRQVTSFYSDGFLNGGAKIEKWTPKILSPLFSYLIEALDYGLGEKNNLSSKFRGVNKAGKQSHEGRFRVEFADKIRVYYTIAIPQQQEFFKQWQIRCRLCFASLAHIITQRQRSVLSRSAARVTEQSTRYSLATQSRRPASSPTTESRGLVRTKRFTELSSAAKSSVDTDEYDQPELQNFIQVRYELPTSYWMVAVFVLGSAYYVYRLLYGNLGDPR